MEREEKQVDDSERQIKQQGQVPALMALSGTQKTLIAVSLALALLRRRNAHSQKLIFRDGHEKKHVFNRGKEQKEKEINDTINEILNNILNPSLLSPLEASLFSIDPIFYFDMAAFSYEPSSAYTKHIVAQMKKCLRSSDEASHELHYFKAHVGTVVVQKTFCSQEFSFKSLLCVLWDVCKEDIAENNYDESEKKHAILHTFLGAIGVALREISLLEEIPACITDDDVARRIHMLVIFSFPHVHLINFNQL